MNSAFFRKDLHYRALHVVAPQSGSLPGYTENVGSRCDRRRRKQDKGLELRSKPLNFAHCNLCWCTAELLVKSPR